MKLAGGLYGAHLVKDESCARKVTKNKLLAHLADLEGIWGMHLVASIEGDQEPGCVEKRFGGWHKKQKLRKLKNL